MSQVIICKKKPEDDPHIADLFLITRQQAFYWQNSNSFKKEDYYSSVKGEEIWVAKVDDNVVGFVSLWLPTHFLHNLFIHPDYQGFGIGKMLLNKACELMHGEITLKVLTVNRRAIDFYSKQGWERVSEHDDSPDGPYYLMKFKNLM